MSVWARLFGEKRAEQPSDISAQGSAMTLADFMRVLGTDRVTAEKAMEIPAFSASVDFIAQTIAQLPVELYREDPAKGSAERITNDPRLFALNDEAELLMTAYDAKRAMIADMLVHGSGYMFIGDSMRTLHYVDCTSVSVQKNTDPIFKDADIRVNERRFYPWQFVILNRRTKDGVTGVGAVEEHSTVLSAAYSMMMYENTVSRTGGNKKGFLQSEKMLTRASMDELKSNWAEFYANNDNQLMILNNGIKYTPSASTAMEMQLSQNKAANAAQIAQIFGLSPEVISGRADNAGFISSMKTAVLPIAAAFTQALNRSLLTEAEKHGERPLYFELDTSALLRADTLSRYQAYEVALRNGFLQIDEVRYLEDKEPLGFEYMKLGLESVLLDPKTKMIYTPNTNQFVKMGEKPLISADESGIIEQRARWTKGAHGYFTGSVSGGAGGARPVRLSKDEYKKIVSEINTNYSKYVGKSVCFHRSVRKNHYFTYKFINKGFDDYIFVEKEAG